MTTGSDEPSTVDGMQVVVEHLFDAQPEQVWAVLTDVPRMAELSPEVAEAAWIDDRTFRATNRRGGMEWTVTCHVLSSERPHRFEWCVSDPRRPSSTWSYRLVAQGAGTLVRQEFHHGPGSSMVRMLIEDQGADPAATIAWRAQMLADDMTSVLSAAASLIAPAAGPR